MFLEKQLPCHPPIFGDWFRIMFPDSYGWYVSIKYISHVFLNSVYQLSNFGKGMKLAQHILELLRSCPWWDTYLGLVIAMEKIYCSILHAEIAYMLISIACLIG